ncbi:MerR family transcriptional regulator [Candidatus Contubernalis alkaliaceticus]|uniref:MerR family transcriptional regulator n=1 Tax=Candidatus Contubernalis alkaliaceticus TaxID=338645 RepID=UPI001F4C3224|nr:MerR family transcriptional regulator [Candidatus Contubernalis alkalaceticus]UNC91796.1 MerR family transcriptional regulator [Candidatus Contubernalis alkalaceticus]
MKNRDREPLFSISVASRLLGITPRVLRSYEEAELIHPYRTEGNTRLYSEQDIRKIQVIYYLHKNMEVNFSGIKIILKIITVDTTNKGQGEKPHDVINKIREIAPELLFPYKKEK